MCQSGSRAVPIRPHHGMCLAYFMGKGYSEGFSAHMEKMLELFETDIPVRLTASTDEICAACPHNLRGVCEAGEKVTAYDQKVLEICGFLEGMEMSFREFAAAVQKKILSPGLREEICGVCQWNAVCTASLSRWEKWQKKEKL